MKSRFLLLFSTALLLLTIACAGGGTNSSTKLPPGSTTPSATASVTQVSIGDGPSDQVASLSLTINAVSLVSDTGTTVSLVTSPTTVEISSLAGTTTPLGTVTIPAGQYLKATITLGSATITRVDPTTGATVQKTFTPPALPFTISLNPPFVSDGTARVINIDLDLHSSVSIDSTTGAINFNPIFLVAHDKMTGPPTGGPPNPFTGGVEHTLGTITAVNGTSFTITTAVGQRSLTFASNTSTVFKNVSGASGLLTGMLVMVEGQAQPDGSLLALGVAVVNGLRNATGVVGIVAKTVGTPVTQIQLLAHGVSAASMMGMPVSTPGFGVLASVTNATVFRVDTDDVDMSGLSLTFGANSISPAQVVEVDTSAPAVGITAVIGGLGGISIGADQVELEQQAIVGTISNLTANSFTLTVAADSAFATLAKTTTVTVYKQPGTQVASSLTLANGQNVVVRGLLFNNSGYKMVATRIGAGPA